MKKQRVSYEDTGRKRRERVMVTETGHHMEDEHGNYNPPTEELRSMLTIRNHFVTDVDGYVIICEHSTKERAEKHRECVLACIRESQDITLPAVERQFPGYVADRLFSKKLSDADREFLAGMNIKP